mgnify:FL=1
MPPVRRGEEPVYEDLRTGSQARISGNVSIFFLGGFEGVAENPGVIRPGVGRRRKTIMASRPEVRMFWPHERR